MTRIAINREVCEPTVSEIKDRYYRKFHGVVRMTAGRIPWGVSSAVHAPQFE